MTGKSLSPDFQEGDYVIITNMPIFLKRIKQGDTIIFKHKEYGLLIKKVADPIDADGGINVIGLHANSVDSRKFGPIQQGSIQGKVLWHIRKPRN